MNPQQLKTGDRLMWGGVEYEIAHIDRRVIRFMKTRGGEVILKSISEFKAWSDNKKIKVISAPNAEITRYANQFSEKEEEVIEKRMAYVKGVTDVFSRYSAKPPSGPSKLISEIAASRNEEEPGFSTVCTWIKNYISSDYNPHALLPRWKNQKRSSTFGVEVERYISEAVDGYYLEKIRFSVLEIAHELRSRIENFILTEGLPSSVKVPSIRTLQRRVNDTDPYKKWLKIYGKDNAGKKFKAAGKQIELVRVFHGVEADGNFVDCILVNEQKKIVGHVYLTVLIDRFSRCILSYELSFFPFCSFTLQTALKKALNDDNGLPGGKIERLIVDNGSDYISSSIKNLCNYSGINIEYAPPGTPDRKPFIERFFSTINTQLFHKLPGTSYSSPGQRGSYNPEREAKLTIEQLRKAIDEFLDIYHNSYHQGLTNTPAQIMQRELKRHVIHPIPAVMVDRVAKTVITRTINKGRISAYKSKWYSHALRTIEHKFQSRGISKQDRKVDVYVDVLNLGKLFIKDPFEEDNFIEADSTTPEYHEGLSLYEHKLLLQEKSEEFTITIESQAAMIKKRMELIRGLHESDSKADLKKSARLSEVDLEDTNYTDNQEIIVEKEKDIAPSVNLRQKISAPMANVEVN